MAKGKARSSTRHELRAVLLAKQAAGTMSPADEVQLLILVRGMSEKDAKRQVYGPTKNIITDDVIHIH